MKKILFAASECVPFIKTGGLADVVGSLPKYFQKEYFDVRVCLPKYRVTDEQLKAQMQYVTHFYMDLNGRDQYVGILTAEYGGITFYFIDNEEHFSGDQIYAVMPWDLEKFAFFSKAVLSALPHVDFRPDIIHCHDWQAALIPVYQKTLFSTDPFYAGMKTIMTIHNLKFQGTWEMDSVKRITGLPDECFTVDTLEFNRNASLLKGGIMYADAVTTVSCSYAEEIKTPFYGEGFDGIMRKKAGDLRGIVNGIDYEVYDPETDPLIAKNYSAKTFRKEKKKNKTALQKELGLEVNPKKMMIGVVSRLTDQKGFDLIGYMMEELCSDEIQLVVVGTGESKYEDMFRYYASGHPDCVSANICYNDKLSHEVYAACDAFLMPSLFEPCGLSQLMSLRYGTLPIVRETGGLRDTVQPYNEYEGTGTGFSFANYNAHEMMGIIRYAERIFYDKKRDWNRIVDRAMQQDYSWNAAALKYQEMYDWMIG